MQAVHQANQQHDEVGPDRAEQIQSGAEAERAQQAECDLDPLDHRDRGLVGLIADKIVEGHLQAHAGDHQPGDAKRGRETQDQESDAAADGGHEQQPEQRRGEQAAGEGGRHQRAGGAKDRRVGVMEDCAHHTPVCREKVKKRLTSWPIEAAGLFGRCAELVYPGRNIVEETP